MTDDSGPSPPGRSIPEATKRVVRADCYFGCVVCGMPVWHYDHIEDWASVGQHEPDNIALLCPNHHQDKTSGRLSAASVARAKANPFNKGRIFSPGYGLPKGSYPLEIKIGGNRFLQTLADGEMKPVIWVNRLGSLIIHREKEGYFVSAYVTDAEGRAVLKIRFGELMYRTEGYDFRYEGIRLRVWQGGELAFDAQLNDQRFDVAKGWFLFPNKDGFLVTPNRLEALQEGRPLEIGMSGSTIAETEGPHIARFNRNVLPDDEYPYGSFLVVTNQW